ncbi:MAG: AgmX/PglI C-terminal domain-containing protein [Chloroherpetonaceae bacterium]|nr:AgmX/PglI C-terminal domain-containing protein [Chloroherpetonaceae bacterium]MDW8466265.1 AgmX/PglI C-terminal domain-containing protein [Chloroherpetonaceae bacterium]
MKTKTSEIGSQITLRWYAEKPFAYAIREKYQQRMIIGFIFGTSLLALALLSYFISGALEGGEVVEKRKPVVINVQADPPPPPSEVQKQEITETSTGGGEIASDAVVTSSQAAAVSEAVSAGVEAALGEALASGLLAESGGGIPVAMEGAVGDAGFLGSTAAGGLRGLGAVGVGGLGSTGLGGGDGSGIGFGTQGAGGGLAGPGSGKGLGGGTGRGLGVGRAGKLALSTNFAKMSVGAGGRSKEEIEAVVKANQPAIYACYVEARQAGDIKGTMVVRVLIAPDGAVRDAQIVKTSITNQNMQRCIVGKMRRMKFKAISGSTIQQVDIPYDFTESE